MEKNPTPLALVFVHYFGGSAQSWDPVIERLDGAFEIVRPDLRGFGANAAAPGPYTVGCYADDIEKMVERRSAGDYLLVGHSMGGKIALALAARRPHGLRGLVLLAPSPPTPEPLDDTERARLLASCGDRASADRTVAKISAAPLADDVRRRIVEDVVASGQPAWEAWLQQGSREDISGMMAQIDVPVFILHGEHDPVMPRALIEREVAGRLAQARLTTAPGAGHLLPFEAPHAVAELIGQAAGQARLHSFSPKGGTDEQPEIGPAGKHPENLHAE